MLEMDRIVRPQVPLQQLTKGDIKLLNQKEHLWSGLLLFPGGWAGVCHNKGRGIYHLKDPRLGSKILVGSGNS